MPSWLTLQHPTVHVDTREYRLCMPHSYLFECTVNVNIVTSIPVMPGGGMQRKVSGMLTGHTVAEESMGTFHQLVDSETKHSQ